MKFYRYTSILFFTVLTIGLFFSRPVAVKAAGIVGIGTAGSCTEASLDAALTGGGSVTFNCGAAPASITVTSFKLISADTQINGGGLISLNGGGTTRFGTVLPGVTAQLSNLTFTNFYNTAGPGGVLINAGNLTITSCTFHDNHATAFSAGAVSNIGTLIVTGSTFSNNVSAASAGAILISNGSLTMTGSTISGNTAVSDGGGIYFFNGTTGSISTTTITNNTSTGDGGAIWADDSTTLVIDEISVTNNTTNGTGGGAISSAGSVTVTESTTSGNTGPSVVKSRTNAAISLTNVTVSNNTLNSSFGALYGFDGTMTINNATIANNTGSSQAGGITRIAPASVTITNSIVDSNSTNNCAGTITSSGYNIDSANTCAFAGTGDLPNTNPLLIALANNGGTTQTRGLNTGSPAINVGNNLTCAALDQRGGPRAGICDRGSFEIQTAPVLAQITAIATTLIDTTPDYVFSTTKSGTLAYGGDCSSATTSATVGTNTITFNILTEGVHSNCTLQLTDIFNTQSNLLSVSTFTIDTTPPVLNEITRIGITGDSTPTYTFSASEAGTLTYSGSCLSLTNTLTNGNNAIIFLNLAAETYTNCTVTPTDNLGNVGTPLQVSSFTIVEVPSGRGPGDLWPYSKETSPAEILKPLIEKTPEDIPTALESPVESHSPDTHNESVITKCKDKLMMKEGIADFYAKNQTISRLQFLSFILLCKENTADAEHTIAEKAKANGFEGYAHGSLELHKSITRAEALKIILLVFMKGNLQSNTASGEISPENLCHDLNIRDWHYQYFSFALRHNLIEGYRDNNQQLLKKCGPDNNLNLEELRKILTLL